MGTAERRQAIMKYLCRCRQTTTSALAEAFSVSERTIRRDIAVLSEREPIYTQPGRYGGGIYVTDNYHMNYIYFSVDGRMRDRPYFVQRRAERGRPRHVR